MELSLIIPAFNEAQRIGPTVQRAHRFLAAQSGRFEIIVVDDGSTDDTVALVMSLAGELPGGSGEQEIMELATGQIEAAA